jgi:SnoaL-like domain
MRDQEIRAALDRHWAASDANDFEAEHSIYREDAVLEYPQSGERIRGRRNIQITRAKQPSKKRFAVRRVIGSGDLWVTEYILTYDGKPSYTVSIMEFSGDKVARENSTLPILSRRAPGAHNGSNGWTRNHETRLRIPTSEQTIRFHQGTSWVAVACPRARSIEWIRCRYYIEAVRRLCGGWPRTCQSPRLMSA